MKPTIAQSFQLLMKERRMIVALSILLVTCLIFIMYVALNIHQNELKIVTHYTAFGTTNFYRDKWYYLIGFAVFGIMIAIMHTLIALKLLVSHGVEIALSFVWVSVIIIIIAAAIAYQVLKIAALA